MFRQLFCLHSTLEIVRVHELSPYNEKNSAKVAWIDTLNVRNFITCEKCNKIFKFKHREQIFGEDDGDLPANPSLNTARKHVGWA